MRLETTPDNYTLCGTPASPPQPPYIWPHGTVQVLGMDTVFHVVATKQSATGRDMWYWRGLRSGGMCIWSPPVLIDQVATISPVIEAGTNGRAAIVYTKPRVAGSTQNSDVAYRLSIDGGLSWGPVVNITNYLDSDPVRAFADVGALWDTDNTLHVVWNTLHTDGLSGVSVAPTHLYHWSSAGAAIRLITAANWSNTCTVEANEGVGVNNLLISKPSLSVKPAGVNAIPGELIYAIWTQFGPTSTDCATQADGITPGGYVNGELYWSISSNDGVTWSRPRNLTCTKTPGCVPGDCHSEHWVTAAARADSGIFLSFLDDGHAGSSAGGEGVRSPGTYRVMTPAAVSPVLEPCIYAEPLQMDGCVAPAGPLECLALSIHNTCNATLVYAVSVTNLNGGQAHVQVNGGFSYSNSIPAGSAPHVLSVCFDGIGLADPSVHNWRLEIVSNDPQNDPFQGGSPIYVDLAVSVQANCPCDAPSAPRVFYPVNGATDVPDQADLAWRSATDPVLLGTDFNTKPLDVAIGTGGPTLGEPASVAGTIVQATVRSTLFGGRSLEIQDISTCCGGAVAFDFLGDAEITQGTVAIKADLVFKELSGCDLLVREHGAYSRTFLNLDFFADGWIRASDANTLVGPNIGRYSVNHLLPVMIFFDLDAGTYSIWLDGALALQNEPHGVVGRGVGRLAFGIHNDADLTGRFQVDNIEVFHSGGACPPTYNVYFGAANPPVNLACGNLPTRVCDPGALVRDQTYYWRVSEQNDGGTATGPVWSFRTCRIDKTGDVNLSGAVTSADIIYLVNYVFKGGAPPLPCIAAGDVNCSGQVNSTDIIYLVSGVFKGGPPPCDVCSIIPVLWLCP
jgi:hypothetical protein